MWKNIRFYVRLYGLFVVLRSASASRYARQTMILRVQTTNNSIKTEIKLQSVRGRVEPTASSGNQTVVVKSQAKEGNKYFYVNMVAASGDNDLYLIGYEVDLKMYELKQTHHQTKLTIAGATLVELTMDYQGLPRHSNAYLGGCECMEKCITTLKAEVFSKKAVTRYLLTMTITFSEAMRFCISTQVSFKKPVPGCIDNLVNKWRKLS
ncbi:P-loop containing nucleoside triphosphatehydrolases superfamily protein [Striga asiatica]|uniref:rRNA N-glycosylase n=1 Tax=Striga asiatica TaxID=4170 RepID=A0A5A7P6N4_STRAF|nr:P-loop containing nucleoside triphosphatehydrolases superfamily protein [Striga asiatica]